LSEGKIFGIIAMQPSGTGGFGYDPIFYVPEFEKTLSELSAEAKNAVSHRAIALQKAKAVIKDL
jgi:XTP/dITP diphosphohydrolase